PLPYSRAMGFNLAFVHLDQGVDDGKADTQAPLRPVQGTIRLDEEIEYTGQHLRQDAYARILDPENSLRALPLHSKPDMAARFGVLRCVAQQVAYHLLHPGRVRLQPDGFSREGDC